MRKTKYGPELLLITLFENTRHVLITLFENESRDQSHLILLEQHS